MSNKDLKKTDNKNNNETDKDNKQAINQEESKLKNLIVKNGDYQIHILIEKVMQLASINDNIPEPVVKITAVEQSKRTKKINQRLSEYDYNDHFYFDHKNLNLETFDSSKILIEVYDKHNSSKSNYIGVTELDYATIYSSDNHSLKNHWIALSNIYSDKDFSVIKGYLRISISILHEDDNRVELKPGANDSSMISTAPHITNKYKQLKINIFKGEDLPDMDSTFFHNKNKKECDAFLTASYMGKDLMTSVVKMKNNLVVFEETLSIPFVYPTTSEKIVFKLYDEDIGSKNDLIGSFEINIYDIIENKYKRPRYIHIYGAPVSTTGKFTDYMNANSEVGSLWKGRVLMSLTAEDTENPIMGVEKLEVPEILAKGLSGKNTFELEIELIDALFLPVDSGKVTFAFGYENDIFETPKRTVVDGNILKWGYKRNVAFFSLSKKPEELSDLFIYLLKGDSHDEKSRYCFQRLCATDIFNNDDIIVFKLNADPAIGNIENCKALLRMKIKITLIKECKESSYIEMTDNYKSNQDSNVITHQEQDLKKIKDTTSLSSNKRIIKLPPTNNDDEEEEDDDDPDKAFMKNNAKRIQANTDLKKKEGHTIICNLYMTKEFVAGDDNGTSDPFVEITMEGKTQSSSVKYDQINGSWNESIVFRNISFDINDISSWPIVYMRVLDEDVISNDPLGYSYIWLSETSYKINSIDNIDPKWHQFRLCNSDRPQGKVLLSFYILENNNSNSKSRDQFKMLNDKIANIKLCPDMDLYNFSINVVGLRKLEPLGILPVRRSYIHFDLNSIIIPCSDSDKNTNLVHQLKSIKTEPIFPGPNPTINTYISFKFNLPREAIFVPSLTCMVYDKMLLGLGTSMLGVFNLELTKIIELSEKQVNEDMGIDKRKLGYNSLMGVLGNNLNDMNKIEEYRKTTEINEEKDLLNSNKLDVTNQYNKYKEEDNKKLKLDDSANSEKDLVSPEKDKKMNESPSIIKKFNHKNNESSNKNIIELESVKNKKDYSPLVSEEKEDRLEPLLNKNKNSKLSNSKLIGMSKDKKSNMLKKLTPDEQKLNDDISKNTIVLAPKYIDAETQLVSGKTFVYKVENQLLIPPEDKYISIGYFNPNKQCLDYEKHYRRYYNCELEKESSLDIKSPFIRVPIRRDKFIDNAEMTDVINQLKSKNKILKRFKKDPNDKNNYIEYKINDNDIDQTNDVKLDVHGYFKGLINIISNKRDEEFKKFIENNKSKNINSILLKQFKNYSRYDDLKLALQTQKELVCRVYILEIRDLANKDIGSESDPYIKIILNDTIIDEKDKYVDDTANAKIFRSYDIPFVLPSAAELKIEVWDYDPLFSDDLIGSTEIDLEDRFYDHNWLKLNNKPVETRALYHPDIKGPQGNISLWCEIIEKSDLSKVKKWKINEACNIDFEMRLIIWETKEIPMMDIEETSDVYVAAFVNPKNKKTTDTHFRCTNGDASFNWRILERIPYNPKSNNTNLTLQVYDKDLFDSDDYICSANINLKEFLSQIYDIDQPFKLSKKFYDNYLNNITLSKKEELNRLIKFESDEKFWINCTRSDSLDNLENKGSILCSLEILPIWKAEEIVVGNGRSEPNCNPYLPPPEGRIHWTWNPYVLIGQLVGPRIRRKFVMWVCGILISFFIASSLPYIVKYLIAETTNPFNYISKN